MTDEVFGPVLTIEPFDTLNEAIARATNTHYGLQPGVFTAGLETALVVAERLRVGAVR
jgi:acyl-CoA reductase-like NAD-dependent aldehyde dehydrogenase